MNQRVVMTSMGNPISSRCAASLGDCECVHTIGVNPVNPAIRHYWFHSSPLPQMKTETKTKTKTKEEREYPLVEQIAEHVLVDDGARHVCAH